MLLLTFPHLLSWHSSARLPDWRVGIGYMHMASTGCAAESTSLTVCAAHGSRSQNSGDKADSSAVSCGSYSGKIRSPSWNALHWLPGTFFIRSYLIKTRQSPNTEFPREPLPLCKPFIALKVLSDPFIIIYACSWTSAVYGIGVNTFTFTVYFLVCLMRWLFWLYLNSLSFYAGL